MKIAIIGAGPAGLYAAILLKRSRPDLDISIFEQNPAGATWGFGVVFSDQALAFLHQDDPETAAFIEPHMKQWSDIAIVHHGGRVIIDGVGFAGIERLRLLQLLQERARALGIEPTFEKRIETVAELGDVDLVIAADGLNSIVRQAAPAAFGENLAMMKNHFVWYGAEREFDALTQTFIDTPYGPMNAHHYSYAPGKATFVIEMTPQTFARTGFADMAELDYRAECEKLFAGTLEGAGLIANSSIWRQFPKLSCKTWHHGNQVLIGDALHTAHFSIGSGTRLALEDVIALVAALKESNWNVADALPAYQAARQPILEIIAEAAHQSATWYEQFEDHMSLPPLRFALSYIQRAGRLDADRLSDLAPRFTNTLRDHGINLEHDA